MRHGAAAIHIQPRAPDRCRCCDSGTRLTAQRPVLRTSLDGRYDLGRPFAGDMLMLPDFPDVKAKLEARLLKHFQALIDRKAPLMARIRRYRQAEGDKFVFEDDAGNVIRKGFLKFQASVEVPMSLPIDQAARMSAAQLEGAAEKIAAQSEGLLFTTLGEAVESVGNVLDARGEPFSPSMMWDAIEKMQVDFNDRGQPEMPTIVLHPDTFEAIRPKLQQWENDPLLRKRRREVLMKKKEEWRDRESNRKLVG